MSCLNMVEIERGREEVEFKAEFVEGLKELELSIHGGMFLEARGVKVDSAKVDISLP